MPRNEIFPGLKFCLGEGRPGKMNYQQSDKYLFGKSHEKPDLRVSNYANRIMTLCGLKHMSTIQSISKRGKWWKTYNKSILLEMRRKRGQMNTTIKRKIYQGMEYNSFLKPLSNCL